METVEQLKQELKLAKFRYDTLIARVTLGLLPVPDPITGDLERVKKLTFELSALKEKVANDVKQGVADEVEFHGITINDCHTEPLCEQPTLVEDTAIESSPVEPKRKRSRTPFAVPSVEEVADYFDEIGVPRSEAQSFHDHYESKGWVVGKTPMKSWKAACRTWKKNAFQFGRTVQAKPLDLDLSPAETERRLLAESL